MFDMTEVKRPCASEVEVVDPDDFTDGLMRAIGDENDRLEVKLQAVLVERYHGHLLRFAAALSILVEQSTCTCTDLVSCSYLRQQVERWADCSLRTSKTIH
ncbi:hypothetical protein H6784_04900 [Candidatus Nomurabacteria bacterium]|nr:hypothetical protein [Candidatus Nomurabacteria bacterium]